MFYDMDNVSCKEVSDMMTFLHKELPDNKIIALPNKTSLESCSKDVLVYFGGASDCSGNYSENL